MPISDYLRSLRAKIGTDLLLMPAAVGIIWNEDGHVLLLQRSDNGLWDFPAGTPDPGEHPVQTLIREVFEETGLHVVPDYIRGVFGGPGFRITYPNGDLVEYTAIVYVCRIVGGELRAIDGEATGFAYFPPTEMPKLGADFPAWVVDRSIRPEQAFQWDAAWLEMLPK
jgi:8-oxo-dGTP pyrophosphatase MutT (NUDIX family)